MHACMAVCIVELLPSSIYIHIYIYSQGQLDNSSIVPPPVIAVPKGETLDLFPERQKEICM